MQPILNGKVAVVTAAARYRTIIAVEFAADGTNVIGLDIAGAVTPIAGYPRATAEDLGETGS